MSAERCSAWLNAPSLAALSAPYAEASGRTRESVLPEGALDLALRQHEGFQRARRGFAEALRAVDAALGDANRNLLESSVNALVGQAYEASWALAWTATAAARAG